VWRASVSSTATTSGAGLDQLQQQAQNRHPDLVRRPVRAAEAMEA
jgi:hypothetical protein